MKVFKDFKTFKKAVRKYWKRYAKRSSFMYNGHRITEWWVADNIWAGYLVDSYEMMCREDVQRRLIYDIDPNNLSEYINQIKNLFGTHVNLSNKNGIFGAGIFNGIMLMNNGALLSITLDGEESMTLYPLYVSIDK